MKRKNPRAPRSCKVEAEETKKMLKQIWESAFSNKTPTTLTLSSELEAKRLKSALADYRALINKRKLENLELWTKIYSLTLRLRGDTVILERKDAARLSVRSAVLAVKPVGTDIYNKVSPCDIVASLTQ